MILTGNISTWRGSTTPPTQYHLWIKEDNNKNYLGTFIYSNNDWIDISGSGATAPTPWYGTQSEYDALSTKEKNKLYFIVE